MANINEKTTTLGEWRKMLLDNEAIDPILGMIKIDRTIRVRFMHRYPDKEFDDMTYVDDFKKLVDLNLAYISIDDGGGGLRAKTPETV